MHDLHFIPRPLFHIYHAPKVYHLSDTQQTLYTKTVQHNLCIVHDRIQTFKKNSMGSTFVPYKYQKAILLQIRESLRQNISEKMYIITTI